MSESSVVGQYNEVPIVLEDGAVEILQTDVNGSLKVNVVGGDIVVDSISVTPPGEYHSSPIALTSGDSTYLQTDVNGTLKIVDIPTAYNDGLKWDDSTTPEELSTSKNSPGKLFTILVVNSANATRYLWFFNNAVASGAMFLAPISVAPNGGIISLDIKYGKYFSNGLTWASSTTFSTYTPSGTADLVANIGYV